MPKVGGYSGRSTVGKTGLEFFMEACAEELRAKVPNSNDGIPPMEEFAKSCVERWTEMKVADRARFIALADASSEMQDTPPKKERKERKTKDSNAKAERKEKKLKDPNAPKRFLSAFFWFSNDERAKVREMNPDAGLGGVAKELGRMWKEVDPEVKQKYVDMAERDRQRYQQEMAVYRGVPTLAQIPTAINK